MGIWIYAGLPKTASSLTNNVTLVDPGTPEGVFIQKQWELQCCPYCRGDLRALKHRDLLEDNDAPDIDYRLDPKRHNARWIRMKTRDRACCCDQCGWWKAQRVKWTSYPGVSIHNYHQAGAALKLLDLTDITQPVQEVQAYLRVRYEERFGVHPRLFEEVVASVFRNVGYEAVVTAYSNDGGIDIILSRGVEVIGVQVKRAEKKTEVEQIRSLAGALVLAGLTKGVFVTTSSYRKGAGKTVEGFAEYGCRIELIDAQRFFDALQLARTQPYSCVDALERTVGSLAELPRAHYRVEHFGDEDEPEYSL